MCSELGVCHSSTSIDSRRFSAKRVLCASWGSSAESMACLHMWGCFGCDVGDRDEVALDLIIGHRLLGVCSEGEEADPWEPASADVASAEDDGG